MRIRVLHDYAGRLTNERRIDVGDYELDDPALFGCGEHLLDIGRAVEIADDMPPAVENVTVTEPNVTAKPKSKGKRS